MDDNRVRLILYWGGEIINGPNGPQYDGQPRRFLNIDSEIRLSCLLGLLHQVTGIDGMRFKIKLRCRYPLYVTSQSITYINVPVDDDDNLRDMLSIPKHFPSVHVVELYIVQEPLSDRDERGESGSFDPSANFSSFSQLLSERIDNRHIGQFISTNTTLSIMPNNRQDQHYSGEGPSNRTIERGDNMEPPQDNHHGEKQFGDHSLDGYYVTDMEVDEEPNSPVRDTVPEDDGANISFYSNIGEEQDCFVDRCSDSERPVWLDDRTSNLEVGMIFKSKEGVQHAVKCWSIRVHRCYKVYESSPTKWFARCLYFKEQNCLWSVRSKCKKRHGFFEITKLHAKHTCFPVSQTDNHPNLDCNMVGRLVHGHIKENVSYKVHDVVEDVRELGVDISYRKGWLGRRKAIEMVYGNWEESYTLLPKYLLALQSTNPGTIVEWKHTESSIGDFKIFHSVFWAFKPCIDGFNHCRPVVSIDGTFQYGKYREKLLIAVGVDAASHLFPLAFAIVDEESLANWAWFLYNVRKHVFASRQGICLISDRARGIMRAVETSSELQPPFVHHRYCLRHVKANFSLHFKNNALTELMYKAACQHQQRKFQLIMNSIRQLNEQAYQWLMQIPLEKWTLSHDSGLRYGIMTTNMSESFNGVLKGARNLPITACVRATFYRLVKYFNRFRVEGENLVKGGTPWCNQTVEKFIRNEQKSKFHRVTAFIHNEGLYEVTTGVHGDKGGNMHTVHLNKMSCTCGKFEVYKMPCSHAMKVCEKMGRAAIDFVDRFYFSTEMIATYSSHFFPMVHEDYWAPSPFHLVPNQTRVNDQPGRPRSTRIQNEMDRRRRHKCPICGEDGHNRNKCPNLERVRERARMNS